MPETRTGGVGSLSIPQLVGLWLILTLGLMLRSLGLGWGLPPSDPETAATGARSSYAFDEGLALDHLAETDPSAGDFDPGLYRWGTLHLSLTLGALDAAQALGAFSAPWREAYREMRPVDFERVYLVARFVSVLADQTTVFVCFLIGLRLGGPWAALWAAALYALAPGAITQAGQLRVDVTANLFGALTLLLALEPQRPGRTGLAAGLAVAAKYSIAPLVAAWALLAWRRDGGGRRRAGITAGAAAAGFLLGEPFILTSAGGVARQALEMLSGGGATPQPFRMPPWTLLAESLANLARFGVGIPTAVLAVLGGVWLWRERRWDGALVLAGLGAGVLAWFPQKWPLLRYSLPLLPGLVGLAAFAATRTRWSHLIGATALAIAGAASSAQVAYRLAPHPANLTLRVLRQAGEAGQAVSNPMPTAPPLSSDRFPPGPNPLLEDLTSDPPEWVVITDLPIVGYPRDNVEFLRENYRKTAVFRSRRRHAWATLGESGAPHDWKYTHPEMTLYRRR